MSDPLDQLSGQLAKRKDVANPPLHLWHPPLSGNIDIRIHSDGSWYHEGRVIQRSALVRLFASILRREDDGDYYLVTPVEKWRIAVEFLPLVIVDFVLLESDTAQQSMQVQTNTQRKLVVNETHPLFLPDQQLVHDTDFTGIPAVRLDHGLAAVFNRATWYRLVDIAQRCDGRMGVFSDGQFYPIEA